MYAWAGKQYLLRRYWDGSDGITLLDENLLCTPDYFHDVIGPKHFKSLKAESRELVDEPRDGLPADFNEMLDVVRARGWTK